MFSLSPILTGFGKSLVGNGCGTVGSRHQGAVRCASSCLAFACRQLRDFSSTFQTLLFQAVFERAFLLLPPSEMDVWSKSTLSVMIHLQGPHRLAAVWTLSCLQSCREKAILGSAQWSLALPPSLLWCPLNYISFSLQPPKPPLSCRPFSLLFYFCSQKAAAGCQSGWTMLRCFCGPAGQKKQLPAASGSLRSSTGPSAVLPRPPLLLPKCWGKVKSIQGIVAVTTF